MKKILFIILALVLSLGFLSNAYAGGITLFTSHIQVKGLRGMPKKITIISKPSYTIYFVKTPDFKTKFNNFITQMDNAFKKQGEIADLEVFNKKPNVNRIVVILPWGYNNKLYFERITISPHPVITFNKAFLKLFGGAIKYKINKGSVQVKEFKDIDIFIEKGKNLGIVEIFEKRKVVFMYDVELSSRIAHNQEGLDYLKKEFIKQEKSFLRGAGAGITNKAKNLYAKDISYLETVNIAKPTPVSKKHYTYGFTKTGLRDIYFNVVSTNYRGKILSLVGTIAGLNGNDTYLVINNAGGIMKTFLYNTENKQVLYGLVNSFYAGGLKTQYGDIKTSLLQYIGVGINESITYETLLKKANEILSKIDKNSTNQDRFDVLFNVNFSNWHKIYVSPGSMHYDEVVNTVFRSYYPINLQTINFYSLIYYLFHNIYYSHGQKKVIAEKLLKDLITNNFNQFYITFSAIPASSNIGNNILEKQIKLFLTMAKSHNNQPAITVMKAILKNYFTNVKKYTQKLPIMQGYASHNHFSIRMDLTEYGTTTQNRFICPHGYRLLGGFGKPYICDIKGASGFIEKIGYIHNTMVNIIRLKTAFLVKSKYPWDVDILKEISHKGDN